VEPADASSVSPKAAHNQPGRCGNAEIQRCDRQLCGSIGSIGSAEQARIVESSTCETS
jgi:hypothetical protein